MDFPTLQSFYKFCFKQFIDVAYAVDGFSSLTLRIFISLYIHNTVRINTSAFLNYAYANVNFSNIFYFVNFSGSDDETRYVSFMRDNKIIDIRNFTDNILIYMYLTSLVYNTDYSSRTYTLQVEQTTPTTFALMPIGYSYAFNYEPTLKQGTRCIKYYKGKSYIFKFRSGPVAYVKNTLRNYKNFLRKPKTLSTLRNIAYSKVLTAESDIEACLSKYSVKIPNIRQTKSELPTFYSDKPKSIERSWKQIKCHKAWQKHKKSKSSRPLKLSTFFLDLEY